jgi:hypothetical protein
VVPGAHSKGCGATLDTLTLTHVAMQQVAGITLVLLAAAGLEMVPGAHWNGCGVTLDTLALPHVAMQHEACVMSVLLALAKL